MLSERAKLAHLLPWQLQGARKDSTSSTGAAGHGQRATGSGLQGHTMQQALPAQTPGTALQMGPAHPELRWVQGSILLILNF